MKEKITSYLRNFSLWLATLVLFPTFLLFSFKSQVYGIHSLFYSPSLLLEKQRILTRRNKNTVYLHFHEWKVHTCLALMWLIHIHVMNTLRLMTQKTFSTTEALKHLIKHQFLIHKTPSHSPIIEMAKPIFNRSLFNVEVRNQELDSWKN